MVGISRDQFTLGAQLRSGRAPQARRDPRTGTARDGDGCGAAGACLPAVEREQGRDRHAAARSAGCDIRSPLALIVGGVVVVLLIACADGRNLLLPRATARAREAGIPAALGASGSRVRRQ